MAAASERKTPLINEYLVTHFPNPSLPTGALTDTARISRPAHQETARNYAHSGEKSQRETGQKNGRGFWRTRVNTGPLMYRTNKDVPGRKV